MAAMVQAQLCRRTSHRGARVVGSHVPVGPHTIAIICRGPQIVLFLRLQGTELLRKLYYLGTDLVLKL